MSTRPLTPELPVFPVVTIHLEDGVLLADAPGADPITVPLSNEDRSDTAKLNRAGAEAASQVAASLGLELVRVEIVAAGHEHSMWLDPDSKALHPIGKTRSQLDKEAQAWDTQRAKQKKLLVIGGIFLVLLMVAACVYRIFFATKTDDGPPPKPGAAQLPVLAPAGWSTYADWSVPSADVSPLVLGDQILYADGSDLERVAASDGTERGSSSIGFKPTSLYQALPLGKDVVTAEGPSGEAGIGRVGEDLHKLKAPEQSATLNWVSGVPVWTYGNSVWIPSVDGDLKRLTAPADSEPMAVDRGGVWMVSESDPKAWHITSDSAHLPEPATIPTEKKPGDYQGPVTGVGNTIVLRFGSEQGNKNHLELVDIVGDGLARPRSVKVTTSGGEAVVDPARRIVFADGVLVNVASNEAASVGTNGKYGAGYAWMTGTHPQRVSPEGETVAWKGGKETSSAAIPAGIDPTGRAVVVAKPENGTQDAHLYVLSKDKGEDQR